MSNPDSSNSPPRVVVWGTYDSGKPRVRILLAGLRSQGARIIECRSDVWGGIEDKSQIRGPGRKLKLLVRWLFSYPGLVFRYLRLPAHDLVLVCYMGQLDVLVLKPFARLRGVPILWDAFLSLYDTAVNDRKIVGRKNPLAWFLYAWEWLACRAASRVLLDTEAHAEYFRREFRLRPARTAAVFVGAEPDSFPGIPVAGRAGSQGRPSRKKELHVLFYGQFIPLHGIETIISAASLLAEEPVYWTIIGQGQEAERIAEIVKREKLKKLDWRPWVPYKKLAEMIGRADACLGIFGGSGKASRVIPNKAFQILMVGKPLITRDSAAIRELLRPEMPGVYLIPPEDPFTLAATLRGLLKHPVKPPRGGFHKGIRPRLLPDAIGAELLVIMENMLREQE